MKLKLKVYNALLVMDEIHRKVYVFTLKKGHTNKKPKIAAIIRLKKWKVVKSYAGH